MPYGTAHEICCCEGMEQTILIIDDEHSVAGVIGLVLEKSGYRVLVAFSLDEAVTFWEQEKESVDVVLSDVGVVAAESNSFLAVFEKPELKRLYMSGSSRDDLPSFVPEES